jgi:LPS sulfotransferase NodH
MSREKAPVFVVGCPRSGTTLLYDMLLSAGNFAVYQAESNVFNLLVPRFGDFSQRSVREKLMDAWLESKLFRATFLDAESIRAKAMEECRSGGDFLRIVMGEIARSQGVERWADNSPEELLYATTIKKQIPDALFIHMIRDGRDVSLSLDARPYAWIRPFSWDREKSLAVAGIFWEWITTRGREQGRSLGADYMEVHFEKLLAEPRATLGHVGEFIAQDLDYDRIRKVAIGSVGEPNTSFKGDQASPAGRWKKKIPAERLALFESLVGPTLRDLGYSLGTLGTTSSASETLRLRLLYRAYFDAKFLFKKSAFGRSYLGPMSGEQIDNTVMGIDPARQPIEEMRSV